jgi:glutathione S-transferase
MRGLPIPDVETVRRAAKRNAPAVRVQIARVDEILDDGRDWIAGPVVTIGDFAVYHALWFITARSQRLAHELTPYPRILAWMERMRAFGHGSSSSLNAVEALDVAHAAVPAPLRASEPFAEDPEVGASVRIRADDYGKDSIEGELVLIDAEEIALRRQDERVGDIVVHFPRLGYDLRAISS